MTTHDKMSDEVPTATESPTEPMDPPMTKTEHGPTDDAMQRPAEDSLSTSAASRKAARKHRSVARPRDLMGEGHEMPAGSEVMGKGHPMPAGSDLMGDRLYETEFETQSETETGAESDPK